MPFAIIIIVKVAAGVNTLAYNSPMPQFLPAADSQNGQNVVKFCEFPVLCYKIPSGGALCR